MPDVATTETPAEYTHAPAVRLCRLIWPLILVTAARSLGATAAPAAGLLRCGSFPLLRRGSTWQSSVKYGRQYPLVGPGTYRVSWKLDGKPLGPTLSFRLPLGR